jgi:ankyrin repeat protein
LKKLKKKIFFSKKKKQKKKKKNVRFGQNWRFRQQMDLIECCALGKVEQVRTLLYEGADANVLNDSLQTPLAWAANEGHAEIVELLLKHGADPGIGDVGGELPLHRSCLSGEPSCVRLLLDSNFMDVANCSGLTPLHFAALSPSVDACRILLERFSCLSFFFDRLTFSLERGAKKSCRDSDGFTALHYAASNGSLDVVVGTRFVCVFPISFQR